MPPGRSSNGAAKFPTPRWTDSRRSARVYAARAWGSVDRSNGRQSGVEPEGVTTPPTGLDGQAPAGRRPWPFGRAAGAALRLLVLGLAVHLLLPQITALEHSLEVLKSLAWWAVLLAIAAQVSSYVGNGYVIQQLVALFGHRLPLTRGVEIVIASFSIGLVWGGQVTYSGSAYRWLRAAGVSREAALLTGVVPALINILTIGVVAAFGVLYLLASHRLSPALAVVFALALALLVSLGVLVWLGMRYRSWLVTLLEDLGRLWARVRRRPFDPHPIEGATQRAFKAWDLMLAGRWRGPVLGDTLNVCFDILTLYMLFFAAHYTANPGLVLAGYGLPLLAGKLSLLPGGLGVVEGGMVALYQVLGVPAGVAVVVILSYRLLSFWIPVLLGFPIAVILDRQGA
jgi:uncharacterized protein (TIRG00374 family)